MARYVIHGGQPGYDRLKILARNWADSTAALLDRVGVRSGMRCLDLGCGAGDVSIELARRVGPDGQVVGIDLDEAQLELTRAEARRLEVDNTEFRLGDVGALESGATYDVVYSRFLLQHLEDPVEALRGMWGAVAPGGALVCEDADFDAAFCEPPKAAHDFWVRVYQETLRANGGDPLCGRRLASHFVMAGVPAPTLTISQRVDLTGEPKLMPYLTVEGTAPRVVESGVATETEIDWALAELLALAEDEVTAVGSPRVFQAWVRRSD